MGRSSMGTRSTDAYHSNGKSDDDYKNLINSLAP